MKISNFKQTLDNATDINFLLPNGSSVPSHFHVTEVGLTTKHFIDCGGTIRTEKAINFQVWVADDYDHRLTPSKLKKIIEIAQPLFENEDLEIEVEYQTETISRFGLDWDGKHFLLVPKKTNCLAKDQCGIPQTKKKINLSELTIAKKSCCSTDNGKC